MAAFNFPSSPNVNDTHTENGVTYKWDGTVWNSESTDISNATLIGDINVLGDVTVDGTIQFGNYEITGNANYLQLTNSATQKVGTNGTLIGYGAGSTTLANNCTIIGYNAGDAINSTAATDNTLIGGVAGSAITSGARNTYIGYAAGITNTTGNDNTTIGHNSYSGATGNGNTVVGSFCGNTGGSYSNCTFVGYSAATVYGWTGTNNSAIGFNAEPSAIGVSNEFTLGDAFITTLRCNTQTISSLSDARDKKNIKTIGLGTDFIDSVRPVEFDWNRRDGSKVDVHDCGFIAQELQEAQDKFDANWVNSVMDSNPEKLEARYGRLIPIMVKAIQELSERVEELKNGRA